MSKVFKSISFVGDKNMNLYILKWSGLAFDQDLPIPTGLIVAEDEHIATDIYLQLCKDYGFNKGKSRIDVHRLEPNVILKWKKSFTPMFFTNIGDEAEEVE
ncbi:MAG: hypothetical protein Q8910_00605 [Bacteroidota bacterium]|nr:hypothetical protein [Bacteroidota bacterium]